MEDLKRIKARLTVVQMNRLPLGEWLKKFNNPNMPATPGSKK